MNAYVQHLAEIFRSRRATIAVIGLGHVGLPLALRLSLVGFTVIGIDHDPEKVRRLKDGISYINYIPGSAIQAANRGKFHASSEFASCAGADSIVICVPTPLGVHREPNLSYVLDTVRAITPHLRPGQLISLESTTYPGTTDEEIRPLLELGDLKVGKDIFLVYSPERIDPGNKEFEIQTIPKLVGGNTPACREAGEALYSSIVNNVVTVSSTKVAELAKLLENIYRAVNIGLVNELKIIADQMGIDIYEVVDAAATKPFGFVPYYPGPGLGGHCLPVDPFYLSWKAREYGVHTRFVELAGDINREMPSWVVNKTSEALNQRGLALRGARIMILGVAYKKDVNDMRESPGLELIRLFRRRGAHIRYSDPHVQSIDSPTAGEPALYSVEADRESLADCNAVVLVTDHSAFNYDQIRRHSRLLIDTRGVYRTLGDNVVRA